MAQTLPPEDDRLEVLARHDHGAVVGAIEAGDEVEQVSVERRATGLADGLEALHGRAVVAPPILEVRPRRAVAEGVVPLLDPDLGDRVAEELS